MVPDKATGIAKGSAFVFVAGKKVSAHPTRETATNFNSNPSNSWSLLTNAQNAERLILLLHECVACPDAPQVAAFVVYVHYG